MNGMKKAYHIIFLLLFALSMHSCGNNSAFLRQLQDMEMGIGNPSTIEELQTAIKKYKGKINTIILSEQRTAIWYKMLGQRYMDNKMYKKALSAFQSALEIYPENQNIFHKIGVCASILAKSSMTYPETVPEQSKQDYLDLSLAAYKRALEIDPSYTRAAKSLSVLYLFELNRPKDAIPLLEPIAAREKKPLDVLDLLGRAYYMTDQREKAIEAYNRIISLSGSAEQRAAAERNKNFIQNAQ